MTIYIYIYIYIYICVCVCECVCVREFVCMCRFISIARYIVSVNGEYKFNENQFSPVGSLAFANIILTILLLLFYFIQCIFISFNVFLASRSWNFFMTFFIWIFPFLPFQQPLEHEASIGNDLSSPERNDECAFFDFYFSHNIIVSLSVLTP